MKYSVFPVIAGLAAAAILGCKSSAAQKETVWTLVAQGKTAEAMARFKGDTGVDERDERGRTALHAAAETNNADLTRFLLSMGARVDAEDSAGRTPLGICAEKGFSAPAKILAEAGASLHHPLNSQSRETAAIRALKNREFLEAVLSKNNVNSADSRGRTLLHLAALEGEAAAVNPIVRAGSSLNYGDWEGKTALDYAFAYPLSERHAQTAEKLILAGDQSSHPFYFYLAPAARSSNYNIRLPDGYTVLHYAAQEGYTGYITFILDKKADVNIKNSSGASALHEAARFGRLSAMELLIARGADVNAQDAKGNSPLHLAVPPAQQEKAITLLLGRGANPSLRDEHGETPLHVMITLGRSREVIATLLKGGADVEARNIEGKTALYLAVETERRDLIPLLLDYRADVFSADNGGATPLEKALTENKTVLDVLLTANAVHQSDSAGNTPLHIAVRSGAAPAVTGYILDMKAAVNARNKEGNTALHIANITNDEAAGTLLISRGADLFAPNSKGENPFYLAFHSPGPIREWMLTAKTLEARDGMGNTALHYAAQWKLAAHVPLLVNRGSNVEAANATGETPLFMAAKANSPETIRALLAAGASAGARDSLGNSALHIAVRWNALDAIDPLLSAGINVNTQNLAGKTPLHEAVRLGLPSAEITLIQRKANMETRDIQGNTPLMEAVMGGFPGPVERLAGAGADTVSRNSNGDTPLHIAVSTQRADLATLLLNNGASIHARNSQGITPFQLALITSPAMVATLLTKDRTLIADDEGLSPLHIAVKQRAAPQMLLTILRRGCRISAVDSEGRTPLRLALDMGVLDTVKLLSDAGSDVFSPAADGRCSAEAALSGGGGAVRAVFAGKAVSAQDSSGNTVLHYAAKTGAVETIGILLELGADKNQKNIAGERAVDIALRWNHPRAAALLQ
ncbi:MAG: ankyrin repeat domain-containing protein [Treponema sp.]|jgi:ankyrin repeat protein|nr:ankyrin repeat domain-containing protein [Treponema sp.]